MQQPGKGEQRQGIGIRQLEEVGAALHALGVRHAQGLAFLRVACPLGTQQVKMLL